MLPPAFTNKARPAHVFKTMTPAGMRLLDVHVDRQVNRVSLWQRTLKRAASQNIILQWLAFNSHRT
jgi:hypothetical protein